MPTYLRRPAKKSNRMDHTKIIRSYMNVYVEYMSFLPTNILSVHMCMYVEYMSFVLTNITYFLFTIFNMCVMRDDG